MASRPLAKTCWGWALWGIWGQGATQQLCHLILESIGTYEFESRPLPFQTHSLLLHPRRQQVMPKMMPTSATHVGAWEGGPGSWLLMWWSLGREAVC